MIVTTTESVPGREVMQAVGIARGSVVRAKHVGSDIVASLRNLVGGEVREYAQLLAAAREQALDRMVEDARAQGADAVVCVRITTSMIMGGASEVMAYGTAVRLA